MLWAGRDRGQTEEKQITIGNDMTLQTPTFEDIGAIADHLARSLGDNLQCLLLHGSLLDENAPRDGRDADLVMVVSDTVIELARQIVSNLRSSVLCRSLNLSFNIAGYHQLVNLLLQGHPFFVGAVLNGKVASDLDNCHAQLKSLLTSQKYSVDSRALIHSLNVTGRQQLAAVNERFRDVYRCLVTMLLSRAQAVILQDTTRVEAEFIANMANWDWLLEKLSKRGLTPEDRKVLEEVNEAKRVLSKNATPALGEDLCTIGERVEAIFSKLENQHQKG